MDCSPQSEPKQGFVSFESTPTNEISPVDSYKTTLSKCCIDPLRPPLLSEGGNPSQRAKSHIPTYQDVADLRCSVSRVMLEFLTNFQLTGGQISSGDNFRPTAQ
jgi:hypothetical protein